MRLSSQSVVFFVTEAHGNSKVKDGDFGNLRQRIPITTLKVEQINQPAAALFCFLLLIFSLIFRRKIPEDKSLSLFSSLLNTCLSPDTDIDCFHFGGQPLYSPLVFKSLPKQAFRC